MEKSYDLTKPNVLKSVLNSILPQSPTDSIFLLNSQMYLAKKALEYILKSDTTTQQTEAARSLIIQGKEANVDEMEIKIENTKGFKLDIPIEDVKVDTIIGADEKMSIKVKYK